MKVRLILEIEERKAGGLDGDGWEEMRREMESAASSVLCDVCRGDSGNVRLKIDGPA